MALLVAILRDYSFTKLHPTSLSLIRVRVGGARRILQG